MVNKILITNTSHLIDDKKSDVSLWNQIYKIIPQNVGLVDRNKTGFKIPYDMVCPSFLEIPREDSLNNFNKTFKECCEDRARDIIKKSEQLNVPIGIFYSGGIDSTGTLVSFLKQIPKEDLYERLIIFMNEESINENPYFYYNFIQPFCRIISSERFGEFLNKTVIFTNGEGADQLFGTDMMIPYTKRFGFNAMFEPYSEENVVRFFEMFKISKENALKWFKILQKEVNFAPIKLNSMLEVFWWFNFNFKWNSCYFRMMLRADEHNRKYMDNDFAINFNQPFYMSEDFQKWAMLNIDKKIKNSWESYKYLIKDLIFSFNNDTEYLLYKSKVGSLRNLFIAKYLPAILTENFEFILSFEKEDYYLTNNTFSEFLKNE